MKKINLNTGEVTMSESRAIIYGDGECREIKSCCDCAKCRYNKGADKSRCYEIARRENIELTSKACAIYDDMEILSNCPLPLWDKARRHGPDEVPESDEDILIAYKAIYAGGRCNDKTYHDVGRYDGHTGVKAWRFDNHACTEPIDLDETEIVAWRYLGVPDE